MNHRKGRIYYPHLVFSYEAQEWLGSDSLIKWCIAREGMHPRLAVDALEVQCRSYEPCYLRSDGTE